MSSASRSRCIGSSGHSSAGLSSSRSHVTSARVSGSPRTRHLRGRPPVAQRAAEEEEGDDSAARTADAREGGRDADRARAGDGADGPRTRDEAHADIAGPARDDGRNGTARSDRSEQRRAQSSDLRISSELQPLRESRFRAGSGLRRKITPTDAGTRVRARGCRNGDPVADVGATARRVCARGDPAGSSARRAPRRVAATRASGDVADASASDDARRPRSRGASGRSRARTRAGRRREFYVVAPCTRPGAPPRRRCARSSSASAPTPWSSSSIRSAWTSPWRTRWWPPEGRSTARTCSRARLLRSGSARWSCSATPRRARCPSSRARLLTSPADLADLPRLWRSLQYLGRALGASGDLFPAAADDESVRSRDADAPRFVRFAEALAADPGEARPSAGPPRWPRWRSWPPRGRRSRRRRTSRRFRRSPRSPRASPS